MLESQLGKLFNLLHPLLYRVIFIEISFRHHLNAFFEHSRALFKHGHLLVTYGHIVVCYVSYVHVSLAPFKTDDLKNVLSFLEKH